METGKELQMWIVEPVLLEIVEMNWGNWKVWNWSGENTSRVMLEKMCQLVSVPGSLRQ